VDGLIVIARLLRAQGDERQAVSYLLVALKHPTCRQETKDRIVAFSLELQSRFSKEEVEGALQWARTSPIEEVVAAWLASEEKGKPSRKKKARQKTVKKRRTSRKNPPKKQKARSKKRQSRGKRKK
jgi:hypothetical protein